MRYLFATAAAAALLAAPAASQNPTAVRIATFTGQSSGALPRARELYSLSVTQTNENQDGFMMGFGDGVVPPDGPVQPVVCFYVGTGPNTTSLSMGGAPGSAPTGLAWAFSVAESCATKQSAPVTFVSIAYR